MPGQVHGVDSYTLHMADDIHGGMRPAAIIYQRSRAGETAEQLAAVYERSVAEVTSAISYEESSRAA